MDSLNVSLPVALLSRIEDAGLNASATLQQRWLDGWWVRFSPGKAKRARCVNPVASGRLSTSERLDACSRLYRQASLPLIVRITPFSVPAELDQLLASQGLHRFDDTSVMVLSNLAVAAEPLPIDTEITTVGPEPFAHRLGAFRGSPLAQRQAHAERLLHSPVSFTAFELRQHGVPAACGQFAMEDDLVGLYDVFTSAHARRRGLAGHLCRHLLVQARALGARHAYLQVESTNLAARAVYRRLGFVDGYAYHYRSRDPSAA